MSLPVPRLLFILSLTILYLLFELAFNARLLDLVGGEAAPDDIEHVEFYGRILSGCAVGLFVVGFYYKKLIKIKGVDAWIFKTDIAFLLLVVITLSLAFMFISHARFHPLFNVPIIVIIAAGIVAVSLVRRSESLTGIVLPLFIAVVCTFISLQKITSGIVESQSDSQRQLALQTVLLQKGLLNNQITLDSIDMQVFSQPEGRAFLATFPLMAMTITNLESKIYAGKVAIVEKAIKDRIGSPQAVYDKQYVPAIKGIQDVWAKYSVGEPVFDVEAETDKQFKKSWGDYTQSLSKHRWTPKTVPRYAKGRVVADVRKNLAVPANWEPSDSHTFRKAVRAQVIEKAREPDGSILMDGYRIAPNLSFEQFVAQAPIQKRLVATLKLPVRSRVQASYKTSDDFIAQYYKPLIKRYLDVELKKYDAPVEKFAPGKELYEMGDQAIRKTLIPTIALLFSLLGAVSHAAKLAMIIITAILERFVRPRATYALVVWLGLVAASGAILLHVDNRVTGSELYANMERQALNGADSVIGGNVSIGVLHVINVGQGYGYPVFEFIRTHVLGGIDYGFNAPEM